MTLLYIHVGYGSRDTRAPRILFSAAALEKKKRKENGSPALFRSLFCTSLGARERARGYLAYLLVSRFRPLPTPPTLSNPRKSRCVRRASAVHPLPSSVSTSRNLVTARSAFRIPLSLRAAGSDAYARRRSRFRRSDEICCAPRFRFSAQLTNSA